MIELQLVGYTADLTHLVLDLADSEDGGRYRLVVDPDLFATLEDLRAERRQAGLPVGDLTEFASDLGMDVATLTTLQQRQDELEQARRQGRAPEPAPAREPAVAAAAPAPAEPDADEPDAAGPDAYEAPVAADQAAPEEPPTWDEDELELDEVDEDSAPRWRSGPAPWELERADADDGWDSDDEDEDVFADEDEDEPTADEGIEDEDVFDEDEDEPAATDEDADEIVTLDDEDEPAEVFDADEDGIAVAEGEGEVLAFLSRRSEPAGTQQVSTAVRVVPGAERAAREAQEAADRRVREQEDAARATREAAERAERHAAERAAAEQAASERAAREAAERAEREAVEQMRRAAASPSRLVDGSVARPSGGPANPPRLTPAQIQARLRAGRSPEAVAREAETDVAWIERWLRPILDERARMLASAQELRMERSRLGRSRYGLAESVRRNLAAKGVAPADVAWSASRRADGRWRVVVRYVSRTRKRSATWVYDPEAGTIAAASDLARDIGFVRRKR